MTIWNQQMENDVFISIASILRIIENIIESAVDTIGFDALNFYFVKLEAK